MPKYRQAKDGDWIQPHMQGYRMACCDCGLVHEMDFEVMRISKDLGGGLKQVKAVPEGKFMVQFQVRRHVRATAQVRRHRAARKDEG